jgi:hypothetical protein
MSTQQLGIVAVQIPLPERALAFLNRALDAIQAAQTDEHPVPTPTHQAASFCSVLSDASPCRNHLLPIQEPQLYLFNPRLQ